MMDVSTGDAAVDRLMKMARRMEREGKKETAEVIYTAASEIARLRAEFRGEEDIGYLVVDTVTNFVCPDAVTGAAWHDEFRAFYDPAKWFGSHRAAAAFLSGKWLQERERAVRIIESHARGCITTPLTQRIVAELRSTPAPALGDSSNG